LQVKLGLIQTLTDNIIKEALDQLRNKKMSVISPGLEIPKEPR
jgi:hypothetical protein